MIQMLEEICLKIVGPRVLDEHPKVQFAAINCLGQLANDFEEQYRQGLSAKVLPIIMSSMTQGKSQRVTAHSCHCVVNIMDAIEKEDAEPFFDDLLAALVRAGGRGAVRDGQPVLGSPARSSHLTPLRDASGGCS